MLGHIHPTLGYLTLNSQWRGQAMGNNAQDLPKTEPPLSWGLKQQALSGRCVRTGTDEVALVKELFPPGPFHTP